MSVSKKVNSPVSLQKFLASLTIKLTLVEFQG